MLRQRCSTAACVTPLQHQLLVSRTSSSYLPYVLDQFHASVLILPRFVANRLQFALLREAMYLADQGVVTMAEMDEIVKDSIGLRWAVTGPMLGMHLGARICTLWHNDLHRQAPETFLCPLRRERQHSPKVGHCVRVE